MAELHPNAALIQTFYEAFTKRDHRAMGRCYHADVTFSDPVFPDLHGWRASAMWRMLCERATDLRIEFRDVRGDGANGSAHWEAWYTFSATGKKVHNVIDAAFTFRDGLIVRHTDRFDFPRWARQAMGLPGVLLGGTGWMHNKVRDTAAGNLEQFIAKRSLNADNVLA